MPKHRRSHLESKQWHNQNLSYFFISTNAPFLLVSTQILSVHTPTILPIDHYKPALSLLALRVPVIQLDAVGARHAAAVSLPSLASTLSKLGDVASGRSSRVGGWLGVTSAWGEGDTWLTNRGHEAVGKVDVWVYADAEGGDEAAGEVGAD